MINQAPIPTLLVDEQLRVLQGNSSFWEFMGGVPPAPAGTPVRAAIPAELADIVTDGLARAQASGEPILLESVRLYQREDEQRVFDLHIAPAEIEGRQLLIVSSTRVPDAGRRVAELTLLHDMVRVLRQQTDLERVLFTTLTCATAGYGLAFNRAFVLLVDAQRQWLEGTMAVGPADEEEAHRIWSGLTEHPRTLEEFAAAYDEWAQEANHGLQELVRSLRFSMTEEAERVPVLAAVQRRSIAIHDADTDPRVSPELRAALGVREFVVAPMLVADEAVGVIMADNRYSGRRITHGDIRLLSLFAQHAGIAIETAQAYRAIAARGQELERAYARLQATQDELVRVEKLAAIGEMAARVAHDVRNPVVTIGSWAQDLIEDPHDPQVVLQAARIISQEAGNLEQILSMLMEPLASRSIHPEPTDLNDLLRETLQGQEPQLREAGIELRWELAEELPQVNCDRAQMRRVIINLTDNAIAAMPEAGVLTIRTGRGEHELWFEIQDTGVGMDAEVASRIFDPFFTTRHYGSGLGLAIVWDIINSHGWNIQVQTEPGQGATFRVSAPLPGAPQGAAAAVPALTEHDSC